MWNKRSFYFLLLPNKFWLLSLPGSTLQNNLNSRHLIHHLSLNGRIHIVFNDDTKILRSVTLNSFQVIGIVITYFPFFHDNGVVLSRDQSDGLLSLFTQMNFEWTVLRYHHPPQTFIRKWTCILIFKWFVVSVHRNFL